MTGDHEAPNTNDLGRVVTDPRARLIVYGVFVVVLIVAGAITTAYSVLGGLPQWALVMNAVLGYLGIPVGTLAAVNVAAKKGT